MKATVDSFNLYNSTRRNNFASQKEPLNKIYLKKNFDQRSQSLALGSSVQP